MRQSVVTLLCLGAVLALSGCEKNNQADVERALKDLNVIDESNLSEVMLTVADPREAVSYFAKASAQYPDRIDLRRGLAKSLVRAQSPADAAGVWAAIVASPEGTNDDRIGLADALIRSNEWAKAEAELNMVPPTHETFERYKLEAMIADGNKKWEKADSFYQTAAGMTTTPSGVYNNWGFSKLSRGDYPGAETRFAQALSYDATSFTAKNNLVLARSAQRKYEMPVIAMSQTERAMLLHTAALAAIKQGDISIGKGLLQEAIDTHPQHFEEAVRALRALDANVEVSRT